MIWRNAIALCRLSSCRVNATEEMFSMPSPLSARSSRSAADLSPSVILPSRRNGNCRFSQRRQSAASRNPQRCGKPVSCGARENGAMSSMLLSSAIKSISGSSFRRKSDWMSLYMANLSGPIWSNSLVRSLRASPSRRTDGCSLTVPAVLNRRLFLEM